MFAFMGILIGLWLWANVLLKSWRLSYPKRKGGEGVGPMKRWAVQLLFRGLALVCLILVVVLANQMEGNV